MPRVREIEDDGGDPILREVFARQHELFGGLLNPTKVLARAQEPIFSPGPEWEKVGQVPNVVFVEGLVRNGGRWLFYYGGADKNVGVATAPAR